MTRPDKTYKSILFKKVPFVEKPTNWYTDKNNWLICIHCKENETIKTPLRLIPWCPRCYNLMRTKHDGTMVGQQTYGIAKDFEDIRKGLVEVVDLDRPKTKFIDER